MLATTQCFGDDQSNSTFNPSTRKLEWRQRYAGVLAVAAIGDKAVAGISGPWSGKFALTWWDRPMPERRLELFDSLRDAQVEVEHWAERVAYARGLPETSSH